MASALAGRYGPWGIIAGGSDGIGSAFAHALAARGMNVVLVARRKAVLEATADEIRATHGVQVRTLRPRPQRPRRPRPTSHTRPTISRSGSSCTTPAARTSNAPFLDKDLDAHLELVQRNCTSVLEAAYRFGRPMIEHGRGAMVLVTSGAAWAGGATLATYGATKAFDLILAEALWAEWHPTVDVLGLVLGKTDTPSMRRALDARGQSYNEAADPDDVAEEALNHLPRRSDVDRRKRPPDRWLTFGAMRRHATPCSP